MLTKVEKVLMHYYSFNEYLRKRFGTRVHRLSLNASLGCPNRDGTLSRDGCVFCNEKGFSHFADTSMPLREQIREGIRFAKERFKAGKFIAYFQNGTNTYASADKLKKAYDTIKEFPDIVGLSISTRPDCVDKEKLDLIESFSGDYEVWVEYGMQSIHDKSLKRINRLHAFEDTLKAIEETSKRNIKIGVHLILGLPGETREDILKTAETIAHLPISGVKFHVLHVLKGTRLEKIFNEGNLRLLDEKEYAGAVCDFLERLKPECVILRLISDARDDILIAPKWINEKQGVIEAVNKEFEKRKTCQGAAYAAQTYPN
jgi:uncharacterized protein